MGKPVHAVPLQVEVFQREGVFTSPLFVKICECLGNYFLNDIMLHKKELAEDRKEREYGFTELTI